MTELSAHLPQFQHGQMTENFPDNHLSNTVCNKLFYHLVAIKLGRLISVDEHIVQNCGNQFVGSYFLCLTVVISGAERSIL